MLVASTLECNSTVSGADGAPSFNNTKSIHTKRVVVDEKTGEIQSFSLNKRLGEYVADSDPDSARFSRYRLQNVAREVLGDCKSPRGKQYRILKCIRTRLADDVRVLMSEEHKRAHYANLMVCGSVWTCPVCAAKISERRKKEIEVAADVHTSAGGSMLMVTLTFSHDFFDKLHDLLGEGQRNGLRGALQRWRNSRSYKRITEEMGLIGLVRNLEVTWGLSNGWHPHVHELWLIDRDLPESTISRFKSELYDSWLSSCIKSGLPAPNRKRGVHIVKASSPAEYLQKWGREERWGISSELAKSHIKSARGERFTPFDLLRAIDDKSPKSSFYASVFRDYAKAFFGARQCYWTPGLKSLFGIKDVTDEQLAEKGDDDSYEVCSITSDEWKLVLSQRSDARPTILKLAETGGSSAVRVFISGLQTPSSRNKVTVTEISDDFEPVSPEVRDQLILSWALSRPDVSSLSTHPTG